MGIWGAHPGHIRVACVLIIHRLCGNVTINQNCKKNKIKNNCNLTTVPDSAEVPKPTDQALLCNAV